MKCWVCNAEDGFKLCSNAMSNSTTKLLRDTAYQQMMLAKRLDSELYDQLKAQYSELCADYCDEQYLNQSM